MLAICACRREHSSPCAKAVDMPAKRASAAAPQASRGLAQEAFPETTIKSSESRRSRSGDLPEGLRRINTRFYLASLRDGNEAGQSAAPFQRGGRRSI
jgi:hypothetical protein